MCDSEMLYKPSIHYIFTCSDVDINNIVLKMGSLFQRGLLSDIERPLTQHFWASNSG